MPLMCLFFFVKCMKTHANYMFREFSTEYMTYVCFCYRVELVMLTALKRCANERGVQLVHYIF